MDFGEEYSAEKVPDHRLIGWPRVCAVAAMVSFSLPTFVTGLEVAHALPGQAAIIALFAGSLLIALIGAVMGAIGAKTRLNSYLLVRIAFGDSGARLVNLAFAVSLLGWFGVNINLFTDAVSGLSESLFNNTPSPIFLAVLASACMTATTLVGFRAINVLSVLLVPVLAVVTGLLAAWSLSHSSIDAALALDRPASLTTGEGISAIVGAIIIGAIILPDITRFCRHWTGALYTSLIAYVVVQFAVMLVAALSGAVAGKTDILAILLDAHLGIGAFVIVIAGSWVLNSLNLYSTVLSVGASVDGLNRTWLTLGLGAFGVIAALMNILDSFITFLLYLSIIFIPVAGVIIVDFFVVQRERYQHPPLATNPAWNFRGFAAWGVSAEFCLLASEGVIPALSNIPAIDAMMLSALIYLALSWRSRSPRAEARA
jgi:cytosine permease